MINLRKKSNKKYWKWKLLLSSFLFFSSKLFTYCFKIIDNSVTNRIPFCFMASTDLATSRWCLWAPFKWLINLLLPCAVKQHWHKKQSPWLCTAASWQSRLNVCLNESIQGATRQGYLFYGTATTNCWLGPGLFINNCFEQLGALPHFHSNLLALDFPIFAHIDAFTKLRYIIVH